MSPTPDLIKSLTSDLQPVERVSNHPLRPAMALAYALLVTLLGVLAWYWLKGEIHVPTRRSAVEFFLLLAFSSWSCWLAIRYSNPHQASERTSRSSLIGPLIWPSLLLFAFLALVLEKGERALFAASYPVWLCPVTIVSIAIPIAVGLGYMAARGAVLFGRVVSWNIAIGSTGFGAVGLSLICPWRDPLHIILMHILPVALFSLAGVFLGGWLFSRRWPKFES